MVFKPSGLQSKKTWKDFPAYITDLERFRQSNKKLSNRQAMDAWRKKLGIQPLQAKPHRLPRTKFATFEIPRQANKRPR